MPEDAESQPLPLVGSTDSGEAPRIPCVKSDIMLANMSLKSSGALDDLDPFGSADSVFMVLRALDSGLQLRAQPRDPRHRRVPAVFGNSAYPADW